MCRRDRRSTDHVRRPQRPGPASAISGREPNGPDPGTSRPNLNKDARTPTRTTAPRSPDMNQTRPPTWAITLEGGGPSRYPMR
eukprot:3331666-Rhodomonas_salina.1